MPVDLGSMNLEERTKYLELKERYKKRLTPWYKRWWGILILTILGLIIILATVAGFYIWNEVQRIQSENSYNQKINSTEALRLAINGPGTNYFLGPDKGAQVTIIEFADFACPFCKQSYPILRKIVARYPGKVKIVWRDMPIHDNSIDLALAARCAGEQGKFWEMHDQLFINQDSLKGTEAERATVIYGLAGTLGINAATFNDCYTNKKYLANISTDFFDSNTLKLKGTPSWFIDGKLLSGYLPEKDFFDLLDGYLATVK